jgi:ribosomal protein L11 methyltransferase
MNWWRLELECPAELEESLLWMLPRLGIHRVALEQEPGGGRQGRLLAWLPEVDWDRNGRVALEQSLSGLGEPFGLTLAAPVWVLQPDEDWSRTWKVHWQPDPVGRRLLILPAWLEPPADRGDRLVVRMDPGSAFGTGSHPTTRLCLEALETLPLQGLHVADLGCGSGILSLAALRLGAAGVTACDIDPLAERATRANAALNACEESLTVAVGSVERLASLLGGRRADLLLCNILAPVIEALCPSFDTVLAPAGTGLLSGLLVDQAPALRRSLAAAGWRAELCARQAAWGLMRIRRAATPP